MENEWNECRSSIEKNISIFHNFHPMHKFQLTKPLLVIYSFENEKKKKNNVEFSLMHSKL